MFQSQGQDQGFPSYHLQCATWQHNNCQIQLQMQLLAHVLGLRLRLRFFIIPFIVCHMATQQLLDLVTNAIAGPCFRVRVKVCHYSHMSNQISSINHCLAHIGVPYTPTPTLTNVHYTYQVYYIPLVLKNQSINCDLQFCI